MPLGGRNGVWFVYTDGSGGTITPPENATFTPTGGGVNGSCFAARLSGSGFASYAGMAFAFVVNGPGTGPVSYDGSSYSGLRFWARSAGASSDITLFVRDNENYSNGAATLYSNLTLTPSWTEYDVPWTSLVGRDGGVDSSQLMLTVFQPVDPASFDIWVDDVQFLP